MTRRTAIAVVITLALVLFLLTSHVFITYRLETLPNSTSAVCMISKPQYKYFALNIYPWMDLTLYTILPSSVIVICNSFIVHNLAKSRMKSLSTKGGTTLEKSFHKIVPMLLLVSTVFVLCTTPVSLYLICKYLSLHFFLNAITASVLNIFIGRSPVLFH